MKSIRRPLLHALIGFVATTSMALAQEEWASSQENYICRSSTEVREIKTYVSSLLDRGSDKPVCRVDYIKDGKTQTLWSSSTSRSYCNDKAMELATKLQRGNFSCKPLHPRSPSEAE